MGLAAILRRLLRGAPPPAIVTRLSASDAIELAKQAAVDHPLRGMLNVATPERTPNGAVVWTVQTGGVGSFLYVVIDDTTGTVLERRAHQGR